MSEVFVEQIIKSKTRGKCIAFRILAIFVDLIGLLSIGYLMMLGITITALLIYGTYLVWTYTSIEYEYSVINSELSIDEILGQRKRKHLADYDLKLAEIIAPAYSENVVKRVTNMKTIDFSSGNRSDDIYSIVMNDNNGQHQILIEPNETVIDALYHARPTIVKKN